MGDAADDLFDSYEDYDLDGDSLGDVECRRCGEEGLSWQEFEDHWALFNTRGERHDCQLTEAEDGFERIS